MDEEVKKYHNLDQKNVIESNCHYKRKLGHQGSRGVSFEKKFKSERYFNSGKGYDEQSKVSSKTDDIPSDVRSNIQESVEYYEKILQVLKQRLDADFRDEFVSNILKESEGKEVDLCCHNVSSHCLELLLDNCKDESIMKRFMSAFAEQKVAVFTNTSASHITEVLIYHSVEAIQNWSVVMNSEDEDLTKFMTYCMTWLTDFAEFALENLTDCLSNDYSCHILCTLVNGLSGDISKENKFRSKNSRIHKQDFYLQYNEIKSVEKSEEKSSVVLEGIPKFFSASLKSLYKSLVNLENLFDYTSDSSSATVIEALLQALKKRLPKSCKKMIRKMAKTLFSEKNRDSVPLALLRQNCSFVVDEMFKVADEDLQLCLWNEYIVGSLEKLVIHRVGNFVIQRIYDAIKSKIHFENICEATWCVFDKVFEYGKFGIFVSMANACNRFKCQQPSFMKNIMMCLQCFEPEERQDMVVPLLLNFQTYDKYITSKKSSETITICLQGSLVVQAVIKFQKPIKVIKSILTMAPTDLEFLAGHKQGCHVLNAFFSSVSAGEKNKDKLLHHLKPVMVSIACDRNKSLTLSRIWVLLSLKLRETVARFLVENESILQSNQNGNSILKKCGIFHFRKHYNGWKEIQSNLTCSKTKH